MKNKILFATLMVLIVASAGYSWHRYLYQENYLTYTQAPCDSSVESCFVYVDPECEGEECESHYKIIFAPASLLNDCQPDEGECLTEKCSQSDSCEIIECSPTSQEEMEITDECSP